MNKISSSDKRIGDVSQLANLDRASIASADTIFYDWCVLADGSMSANTIRSSRKLFIEDNKYSRTSSLISRKLEAITRLIGNGGCGAPPQNGHQKIGSIFIKSGAYYIKSGAKYNLRVFLLGNNQREINNLLISRFALATEVFVAIRRTRNGSKYANLM